MQVAHYTNYGLFFFVHVDLIKCFLCSFFHFCYNNIFDFLDYVPHPDDLVGDSDYFESNDDDDHGRGRRRNEFASSFSSDNGHALHLQNLSTKPPPPYSVRLYCMFKNINNLA